MSKRYKLSGFVKEGDGWKKFYALDLMRKNESDYKVWHSKYKDRIHTTEDEEGPRVHFHRGHGTFHYFGNRDENVIGKSNPMTLSHHLRQDVIEKMTKLSFSVERTPIDRRDKRRYPYTIIPQKSVSEARIRTKCGNIIVPDVLVHFTEPADLALKWNGTLAIEVVETHDVGGAKIAAYQELGFGVIAVHDKRRRFNELNDFKIPDLITREKEVKELERKIQNFYKKSIWSELVVDPDSEEFKKHKDKMLYPKLYEQLQEELHELRLSLEESEASYEKLRSSESSCKENLYRSQIKVEALQEKADELQRMQGQIWKFNQRGFFKKLFIRKIKIDEN